LGCDTSVSVRPSVGLSHNVVRFTSSKDRSVLSLGLGMLAVPYTLLELMRVRMSFIHLSVLYCGKRSHCIPVTGCLQLLEILEISWNLNGPPGNFCVMIEN